MQQTSFPFLSEKEKRGGHHASKRRTPFRALETRASRGDREITLNLRGKKREGKKSVCGVGKSPFPSRGGTEGRESQSPFPLENRSPRL